MKAVRSFLQRLFNYAWFYPVALLVVGMIAYGLMIPRLGFYWDDWESVYLNQLHNPALSFPYYTGRPFSAIAYLIFFPFVKMTPPAWQVLAILLRWGGILFLTFSLNRVWPRHATLNRWIGVLLIVFPGYFDQPVSTAFTPHLTTFLFFTISLYLTVLAIKDRPRFWLWMPLSLLFGITQIFMMEYFVALEIIRPLLVWFMLTDQGKSKRKAFIQTFLYWLPFIIGLLIYTWWRFFYIPTTLVSDTNDPGFLKAFLHTPVDSLVSLVIKVYTDFRYLLIDTWANAFYNTSLYDLRGKILWGAWLLGLLTALGFGFYIRTTSQEEPQDPEKPIIRPFFLGIAAFLAGCLPVWSTGRQVFSGKWSDRFALAPMVGIVILVVYLIDWLFRTQKQKNWLLVLLLGFSISAQIWNENSFRADWELQRSLYWQLAWRIPVLKPGTAIIGKGTFTDKSNFLDGTYIINLLFDKQVQAAPRFAYLDVFHITSNYYHPNYRFSVPIRGGIFSGNSSQVIGMNFDLSGGCVLLLDPVYQGDTTYTENLNSLFGVSNLSSISVSSAPTAPDPAIFGTEPAHTWCYYFEKADLARQRMDWQSVLQLGAQAEAKGLAPVRGAEYIPFIEAYAHTGDWSKAFELSQAAIRLSPTISATLCNDWNQLSLNATSAGSYLTRAHAQFCTLPAP